MLSSCLCFGGTEDFAPPEFFTDGRYEAVPTTVWQLGTLLYEMLDGKQQFSTSKFLRQRVSFNIEMSQGETMEGQLCFGVNCVEQFPYKFQAVTAVSILIVVFDPFSYQTASIFCRCA